MYCHAPTKRLTTKLRPASLLMAVASLLIMMANTGCRTMAPSSNGTLGRLTKNWYPSNDRDWTPEMAVLPQAVVEGSKYHLKNIRNCQYLTAEDFVVNHYDRTIDINQVQSVDFVVVPFNEASALAHTMLSFGLDDGSYLGMSVEVRKERDEKYSPVLGLGRKFELMYVLADERDLIRLRARHRNSDVYAYPTVANEQQARMLFAQMAQRMNKLSVQPEFYNSLTNNCTTNIKQHVNQIASNKVGFSWRILLPGYSARYAYDRGLLDQRIPFEDLTSVAMISGLAERHYDDPRFSTKIRSDRARIARLAQQQSEREPVINGSGARYLESIDSRWR